VVISPDELRKLIMMRVNSNNLSFYLLCYSTAFGVIFNVSYLLPPQRYSFWVLVLTVFAYIPFLFSLDRGNYIENGRSALFTWRPHRGTLSEKYLLSASISLSILSIVLLFFEAPHKTIFSVAESVIAKVFACFFIIYGLLKFIEKRHGSSRIKAD